MPEANVSHVQLQHWTCHAYGSDNDAKKAYDKCTRSANSNPRGPPRCYSCGKLGYIQRNCPKKKA